MARLSLTKACSRLLEHDDILFLCHRYPDGDTIGSAFALCRAVTSLGKRASVMCGDILPPKFSYIFSDIEPVELSAHPYIVAVDVADPQLLGVLESEYGDKVDLCIDHHPSNRNYAGETYVDANAAAVGEIVYRMLNGLHVELTQPLALALYTAIATDTGCFRFSNVTANTLRTAAKLIETGIDFYAINQSMFETKSRARLQIERELLESLDYRAGGSVAMMTLTCDMMERANACEGDIDGVSGLPRCIEGVKAGIMFREVENGYKVSVRSVPGVNACEMCRLYGGGGHAAASGCVIKTSLDEAKDLMLEAYYKVTGEE